MDTKLKTFWILESGLWALLASLFYKSFNNLLSFLVVPHLPLTQNK